jgi:hypothetical protein
MEIVELRQYVLHPGRRDDLVALFDREFVEPQETNGLRVIGTFRDLDDPDRFVWFRGFPDLPARRAGLEAFYDGPVWQTHKHAANATMIDSDDVLLLRPVVPFADAAGPLVVVTVLPLDQPAENGFLSWFQTDVEPLLAAAGSPLVALLVTDSSPNTFPRLPVREGERVLVRVSGFSGEPAFADHQAALQASAGWSAVAGELTRRTRGQEQVLRLVPTPRSRLR